MSLASLAGYDLDELKAKAPKGRTARIRQTLGIGARSGFEQSEADVSIGVTSTRSAGSCGDGGFNLDFSKVNMDPVSPERVELSERSRRSGYPPRAGLFDDDARSVMTESTVGFGTTRRPEESSLAIGDKLAQLRNFVQSLAVLHRNKIFPDPAERLSIPHAELIRRSRRRLLITRFKRAMYERGSARGAIGETDGRGDVRDGFGNLLSDRAIGRRGVGVANALRGDRDQKRGGASSPARGSAARALRRRAKKRAAATSREESAARAAQYTISLEAFTMALTAMHPPGRSGLTPVDAQLLWNRCRGNFLSFTNNLFADDDVAVSAATNEARNRTKVPGLPLARVGTMGRTKKKPSAFSMAAQQQGVLVQSGLFDPHGGGERALLAPKPSEVPSRIRYRHSKTPVRPPTGWNSADVPRSATLPDALLEIEHVYGYNSRCVLLCIAFSRAFVLFSAHLLCLCLRTVSSVQHRESGGQNLHWAQGGNLAYFTAGVAIVLDPIGNTQRFYTGHDDDVTCLAIDRSGRMAATGQTGARPFIAVWDMMADGTPTGCDEIARLGWVKEIVTNPRPGQQAWAWKCWYSASICCVAFTADSRRVIGVGGDENHSVGVWDISTGLLLCSNVTQKGIPPQVYDVVTGKLPGQAPGDDHFVTVGPSKHLKFWTATPQKGRGGGESGQLALIAKAGTFYPMTPPRGLLCADFVEKYSGNTSARGLCVVGGDAGDIFLFDVATAKALVAIKAHGKSPVMTIAIAPGGFISGGRDGTLKRWRFDPVPEDLQAEYDEQVEDYIAAVAARHAADDETNQAALVAPERPAPPCTETRVWDVKRWYEKQLKLASGDDLSEMGKVFKHKHKQKRTFKTKKRSKSRLRFDSQEYAPGGDAAEKKRRQKQSRAVSAAAASAAKYGSPPPLNVRSVCVRLMSDAGDDATGGYTGDELEDEAEEELMGGAPVDRSKFGPSTPLTICFGSTISSVYVYARALRCALLLPCHASPLRARARASPRRTCIRTPLLFSPRAHPQLHSRRLATGTGQRRRRRRRRRRRGDGTEETRQRGGVRPHDGRLAAAADHGGAPRVCLRALPPPAPPRHFCYCGRGLHYLRLGRAEASAEAPPVHCG